MNNKLLIWMFVLLLVVSSVNAIDMGACASISSSGTYDLTNNITASSDSDCIDINVDNVVLNCHDYNIIWNSGSRRAIDIYGSNVTLNNCVAKDWPYGIFVNTGRDDITFNNYTYDNCTGAYMLGVINDVTINKMTITNNPDMYFYVLNGGPHNNWVINEFSGALRMYDMFNLTINDSLITGDQIFLRESGGYLKINNLTLDGEQMNFADTNNFDSAEVRNSNLDASTSYTYGVNFYNNTITGSNSFSMYETTHVIDNSFDLPILSISFLNNSEFNNNEINSPDLNVYDTGDISVVEFNNNIFNQTETVYSTEMFGTYINNTIYYNNNYETFLIGNSLYYNNTFDGNEFTVTWGTETNKTNMYFEGNNFLDAYILAVPMTNSIMTNNYFSRTEFQIERADNTIVKNNLFVNAGISPISQGGVNGNNLTIQNNSFYNNTEELPSGEIRGIRFRYHDNSIIRDNYFENIPRTCIGTWDSYNVDIYNNIADNRVRGVDGHGIMIRDNSYNITVYDNIVYNMSYGYLFEQNASYSIIRDNYQYGSNIFYSLHDTHHNKAYNNYIEGDVVFFNNASNEYYYNNTIIGDVEFIIGGLGEDIGSPSNNNVLTNNTISGDVYCRVNTTGNIFYDNIVDGNIIVESGADLLEYYTISVDGTEDTTWSMEDSQNNLYGSYNIPYDDYYLSVNYTYGNNQTFYPYTITATYGDAIEVRTFNLIAPKTITFTFNEVIPHLQGVKVAVYAGFGLIAVALLAGIAFLITKMFSDGFDMAALTAVSIMAIGLAFVLFVGYIIISAVANGLIG